MDKLKKYIVKVVSWYKKQQLQYKIVLFVPIILILAFYKFSTLVFLGVLFLLSQFIRHFKITKSTKETKSGEVDKETDDKETDDKETGDKN